MVQAKKFELNNMSRIQVITPFYERTGARVPPPR